MRASFKFSASCAPRGGPETIQAILAFVGALAVLKVLSDWSGQGAKEWAGRAHGLYEQGRHAEAVQAYGEAIRADPNNAQLHSRRGHALRELGRHSEALDDYNRAVELDNGSAAARCDAADMLMALGHPNYALDRARQAIALSPKSARAHRTGGEALWMLDKRGAALDALHKSADLHDTPGLRVRIAEMRCGRGDHAIERRELDRAISMEAGNTDLHYRRARALLHIAREDPEMLKECVAGAITDLETALGIDPRHEEAAEMLRRAKGMLEGGG